MIARLHGKIVDKSVTELVIDCGGVGYSVLVTVATSERLTIGGEAVLHTYLAVREDALQLFGFAAKEEREAFLLLTSISGIGGKTALAILSSATIGELQAAVLQKNSSFLQKLPGIGKKTAERIVLELQDKIAGIAVSSDGFGLVPGMLTVQADALAAMVALGYNRVNAEKAVRQAINEDGSRKWTTDTLLRAALKFMN